jgi:flagellar biogenesis protein FliO
MLQEYAPIFQMIGFLILIIICTYLVIRYGLRALYPGVSRGAIRVLERVPLDHRQGSSLVLARVGESVLLIGVAQGRVSLLKEIDPESLPPAGEGAVAGGAAPGLPFSRILQRLKRDANPEDGDKGGLADE